MTEFCHRPYARLALIGLTAVALGLAGCGRKAGLDLPPGSSMAQTPEPEPAPQPSAPGMIPSIGSAPSSGYSGLGVDGKPVAPAGPKKRIFLDNLLN